MNFPPSLASTSDLRQMRRARVRRIAQSFLGLTVCSLGIYLTVVANIGMSPWDALNMAVSYHLPIGFGTASAGIGLLFVFITAVVMKEPIGLNTILDPLIVGPLVDIWSRFNIFNKCENFILSIFIMCAAMLIVCVGQWLYMAAGLCCGPRDCFMVVVGKYLPRIPISVVNGIVLFTVIVIAYLMDGPVGFGTAITLVAWSSAMQIVFKTVHFEPRSVQHENILTTFSVFLLAGMTEIPDCRLRMKRSAATERIVMRIIRQ